MRIANAQPVVTFKSLDPGEVFRYGDRPWMKTAGNLASGNCVGLDDGRTGGLADETLVVAYPDARLDLVAPGE